MGQSAITANFGGTVGTLSSMPEPLGDVLDEAYPEITHTVLMSWEINMVLTHENQAFRSEGRYFGSDFFTVFKLPLLVGDPATTLLDPESIAISESLAKRYFGDDWRLKDDLLGTTFRVDNRLDVSLTAVFEDVAISSQNPLSIGQDTIGIQWDGKADNDNTLYSMLSVGYDFIETVKIKLRDGRVFSPDFGTDPTNYIINEKAALSMGMEDPAGQPLTVWDEKGVIIGRVKDFHMQSLYSPIEPVIIRLAPASTGILFIRIATGQTEQALTVLEAVYKKFNPEYPFTFRFLADEYEQTYRSETVIGTLANLSAILTILIACLGLFGLASFTAEQRRKEIGIRKVLGASITKIVMLLSREFILLVVAAYVVSAPIAYYVMSDWLTGFTFHTEISIGILAGAGIGSVLTAWLTVSYQAIRAATTNPVKSLQSE
ncbi:MAG: FtsX-like permease family protein [Gemmatimonadota bacterium]|nr:FtsX-like permease family protein [Gemmatimonadota bacterium]